MTDGQVSIKDGVSFVDLFERYPCRDVRMLLELAVENYAVVDKLRVTFSSGLNLLTGETGSGKSILVGALDLLFGGRASADLIRSGEQKARVSGRFEVSGSQALLDLLAASGFEPDDGELLIEREILASGKSRVYVSSRPATAALLKEIAPHLGDIHGQHDQQQLFSAATQRNMLDAFANAGEIVESVGEAYRKWRYIQQELAHLEGNEQEKLRQLDLWLFQRNEIQSAALLAAEDVTLEEERRVQQNVGRLLENAGAAYTAVYEAPESAYALLKSAMRKLDDLTRIDSALHEIRQVLEPASIAIQEASDALRDYLAGLEADPARLEEVETRLALIERLKRKYGGSVDAVFGYLRETELRIGALENADVRVARLRVEQQNLVSTFEELAGRLTQVRREAASRLAGAVEQELGSLSMERTVFRIHVGPSAWSEAGTDEVRFLASPNRGEEPKPIEKIASGGEISRIALALKTCLVASTHRDATRRTLVFDEVDTGIGGSAAEGVGRRLKRLASSSQVLCVTHLAQVASFADHHFRVEKLEINGRTTAQVVELNRGQRREEVARMISGHRLTTEALKHADQLIELATAV